MTSLFQHPDALESNPSSFQQPARNKGAFARRGESRPPSRSLGRAAPVWRSTGSKGNRSGKRDDADRRLQGSVLHSRPSQKCTGKGTSSHRLPLKPALQPSSLQSQGRCSGRPVPARTWPRLVASLLKGDPVQITNISAERMR